MFGTSAIPSFLLLLLSSYAIRIFEGPAQARQSLYFWDQLWLVRRLSVPISHCKSSLALPSHVLHVRVAAEYFALNGRSP